MPKFPDPINLCANFVKLKALHALGFWKIGNGFPDGDAWRATKASRLEHGLEINAIGVSASPMLWLGGYAVHCIRII